MTKISGTLTNQATIETAHEGGPYVQIKLSEFSDFNFNVSEVMYNGLKAMKFTKDVKVGDIIQLSIQSL